MPRRDGSSRILAAVEGSTGRRSSSHSRTGLFSKSSKRRRRARHRLYAVIAFLLLVTAVTLGVLAVPLLQVQKYANHARSELAAAKASLTAGDADAARAHAARARDAVEHAQDRLDTLGARVWGSLPVAGGAVDDIEHLVTALEHTSSMADIGVSVYPSLTGDQDPVYAEGQVNLKKLKRLIAEGRKVGDEALAAQEALDQVKGGTPFVGSRITDAREEASQTITPIADGYRATEPLLGVLPQMLGARGPQSYLIAIMNPAELRYSGGATLTLNRLDANAGALKFGQQIDLSEVTKENPFATWEPVRGNPFHFPGEDRVSNATYNPDWPVSAEELQRAWAAGTQTTPVQGVIAVDVPALAELVKATGPLEVEGVGTVTGDQLTETLIGSYDDTTPEQQTARRTLNRQLATVFRDRVLQGGKFVEKGQVLGAAATGRHLAMWSSDTSIQRAFEHSGLAGQLSDARHDYLGVFSRNTNSSKVDYYQRRTVESVVTLREDGSAAVTLQINVYNESPPYAHAGLDPRTGYWTRFSEPSLVTFLPHGAKVLRVGSPVLAKFTGTQTYDERPFFMRTLKLPQGKRRVIKVEYVVPHAATVTEDGLDYRLTYDPQGMVTPQGLTVKLIAPKGLSATGLPDGWTSTEDGAVLDAGQLDARGDWTVRLTN